MQENVGRNTTGTGKQKAVIIEMVPVFFYHHREKPVDKQEDYKKEKFCLNKNIYDRFNGSLFNSAGMIKFGCIPV